MSNAQGIHHRDLHSSKVMLLEDGGVAITVDIDEKTKRKFGMRPDLACLADFAKFARKTTT